MNGRVATVPSIEIAASENDRRPSSTSASHLPHMQELSRSEWNRRSVADNFNDVFLHLVWATWDRQPFLTPAVCDVAYPCIMSVARARQCPAVVIGGVEDH